MDFELIGFILIGVAIFMAFAGVPIWNAIKAVKVNAYLPLTSYQTFIKEGEKVRAILHESKLHPSSKKHKWKERIYQIKVKYKDTDGNEKIIEPNYNHFYKEEIAWMKKQKAFDIYVYKDVCVVELPAMKYNSKTKGFDIEE